MAPRANWKGYLRLSLVSCPIQLFPATSESEKIRFHRINRKTGNRVKLQNLDAGTGEALDRADLGRGYEIAKGQNVEITDEELEAIEIGSSRTIEIDRFVPKAEIDQTYIARPYYVVPDGDVGQQAFAVIREAIGKEGMVALGRVVLTSREHVIALEPRGKGLIGTLLRYPYEVRDESEYFDDIADETIPKDMLELATHIVRSKAGHFTPEAFEDRYENALRELLSRKQAGERIVAPTQQEPARVVNLMDALKRSLEAERPAQRTPARRPAAQPRRAAPKRSSARARKAG